MKNQNTKVNRKAVVYASQALENAAAIAQQIESAQKLAAEHGLTDCEVVSESGSGLQIRPGLQELLKRVEAGEISHVITVTQDRITRDASLREETMARMAAAGTSLLVARQ